MQCSRTNGHSPVRGLLWGDSMTTRRVRAAEEGT